MESTEFDPSAGERRVFTDERHPGIEIVNYGNPDFMVYQLDRKTGRFEAVDEFRGFEHHDTAEVSYGFAERRAQRYFERMSSLDMSGELNDRPEELDIKHKNPDRETEAFTSPDTDVVGEPNRDFSDEQVMTHDDVLDMWEKANAMSPGPEKDKMIAQVKNAASQLESAAETVVSRLIQN